MKDLRQSNFQLGHGEISSVIEEYNRLPNKSKTTPMEAERTLSSIMRIVNHNKRLLQKAIEK